MHVTPSLHTNCFGLQVFGAEEKQRKSELIKRLREFKKKKKKHPATFVSAISLCRDLISKLGPFCLESIMGLAGPN